MGDDLWRLGACEMAQGIRTKAFSSREAVQACIDRIVQTNDAVNAMTEIRAEDALAAADAADAAVAGGHDLGSLHGVPLSIKGNIDVAGWLTINGSAMLKDNVARENSPCVQNWLDAGAVIVGRTNTPEYCCRWETTNDVFGATKNPWSAPLSPGGSSGGAAASIAVGQTPLAHGTDLGGSLRHPAQACGVASIRPSKGRVPGYVPSEPESPIGFQLMNTDGPIARRVEDLRLAIAAMARGDWRDPWWVPAPLESTGPTDLPIAIVVDPLDRGVHEQVASGVEVAKDVLEAAGHDTQYAAPSTVADAVEVWRSVVVGELFMGLEPAVKDECGSALLRAFDFYHDAVSDWTPDKHALGLMERRRVLRDWLGFFQRYSVIVSPVSTLPPQVSDFDVSSAANMKALMDSMTMVVSINALGLPSAVVPVGEKDGLPRAVQVIGAPFQEMRCLEIAEVIENGVSANIPIDPR